jgi:hypothetical protein
MISTQVSSYAIRARTITFGACDVHHIDARDVRDALSRAPSVTSHVRSVTFALSRFPIGRFLLALETLLCT